MVFGVAQGQLEQALAEDEGEGVAVLEEDHFVDAWVFLVFLVGLALRSNLIGIFVFTDAEFGLLSKVSENIGEVRDKDISDEALVVLVVDLLDCLVALVLKEVVILQDHLHIGVPGLDTLELILLDRLEGLVNVLEGLLVQII